MEELDPTLQGASPEPEPEAGQEKQPAAPGSAAEEAQPLTPEAALENEPSAQAAPEYEPLSPEAALSVDELMQSGEQAPIVAPQEDVKLKAVLEAVIYVAEEPLTAAQIAASLQEPQERIHALMEQLMAEFEEAGHGVYIREIAGGYKMATKPEHHDAVRNFVKSLKPPLKLSLPALETLAVIAYKQPVTGPEVLDIRGVQGGGVMKTLLDRKLIAVAGRKNVIGKPILYKTTKEFLIQFGLKDLSELPSLKEFEEIRRMAFDNEAQVEQTAEQTREQPAEQTADPVPGQPGPPEAAEPEPAPEAAESEAATGPAPDPAPAAAESEPAPEVAPEPTTEPKASQE